MFKRIGLCVALLVAVAALPAKAADLYVKAPPAPTDVFWRQIFAGFAVSPHAYFGDVGGVFAFNRTFETEGWLMRARVGAGEYSYFNVPGSKHSVAFETGELMLGYQKFFGVTRVTGYFGIYGENHDNDSDPFAKVSGSRGGVRGQLEIYTPLTERTFLFAQGSATNVFNGYFVLAKVGYRLTDVISLAPELIALGNERFDAVRFGPSLGLDFGRSQIFISAGYSWDMRSNSVNDDSGAYAFIHARTNF